MMPSREHSGILLFFCLLASLVGLAFGGGSGGSGSYDMPEILYVSDSDRPFPVFVSAQATFSHDGKLSDNLFSSVSERVFEDLLSDSTTECVEVEEHYLSLINVPDRSSLEKGVDSSELIVLGTVTGKEYGFHAAEPGQLIRVETKDILRSREGVGLGEYYFFFPVGNFSAGPYKFCKIDRRYGDVEPEIGDKVLLMPYRLVGGQGQEKFLEPGPEGIVIIKSSGEVIPLVASQHPDASATSTTEEDLLKLVRSALGKLEWEREK